MICVAICTRERPKMLRRMLESCANLSRDHRSNTMFVIIENGEIGVAHSIVDEFSDELNICCINENRQGIVNARNAAIEFFLTLDADWMASFDDDEMVSSGWLKAMLDAIDRFPECRVFAGPQVRLESKEASIWFPPKKPKPMATGTKNWNVSTANVLFHRSIFSSDGLGVRFDSRFNFSGGEDTQLFYQLKDIGEQILWVSDAECVEPTIPERATFLAKAQRTIVRTQNWGTISLLRFGRILGGLLISWFMVASAINVFSYAIIGVIVLVFSEKSGVAMLSRSLENGCQAIGYFKTIFRKSGSYYVDTDGG